MAAVAVVAQRRGSAPPELVGALVKTLGTAGWEDRRAAALALGRLGPGGHVDEALVKAAGDASSFVREAVAIALGQTGGGKAAAALGQLAHDDVQQVREAATRSLEQLKH
jgi:HEAT repeat protein